MSKYNIEYFKLLFKKYKQIGTAISISLIYRMGIVLINLVTGIAISRELLAANRGVFNLFLTSAMMFNLFLGFGLINSIAYYAHKDKDKMRMYFQANFYLAIISSVIIIFLLNFYAHYFKFQSFYLASLFVFTYCAYSFKSMVSAALLGVNEAYYSQKLDFKGRMCYFIFISILYFTNKISLAWTLTFITLEFFVYSYFGIKKLNIKLFPFDINFEFLKETFFINSKSYISMVMTFLLLRSDQYIIKYYGGNFQVGLYSTGSTIIENMCMVTAMVTTFYFPKLMANTNLAANLAKSKKILLILFASSVAMMIPVYFLSPYLIQCFLKKSSPLASQSLQILLIGFLFWSLFIFINAIYMSIRIKKSFLIILGICVLLNLVSNYIFYPKYGLIGVAWSSSICYAILFILSYIDLFILKRNNFLKKELDNEQ